MRFILLLLLEIAKIPRAVAMIRTRRPRRFEKIMFIVMTAPIIRVVRRV